MGEQPSSGSLTITQAREKVARVADDLRRMQAAYGRPAPTDIEALAEELALLVRDGFLERVDVGFRRFEQGADRWILLVTYVTRDQGNRTVAAASFPRDADVAGCRFCTHVWPSASFLMLTNAERRRVEDRLPLRRWLAGEPGPPEGRSALWHRLDDRH